jgi:NADP-dependent 3-hydroxy acid dehydrogenase YdfG
MALTGQVALVTGATSGIGKASAEALAAAGARLVLTGRQEAKLAALAATLPDSVTVAGDITDPALPDRLVARALEACGRLDICLNNAGSIATGTIEDIDIDAVCRMARINVEAAYRMAYGALRHFRAAGTGHLINISSVLGSKSRPTAGAYAGTKHAIEALSEALRVEIAGSALKVSCIEPGLVMTELHRDLPVHPREGLGVARPLMPEDIARLVVFVAEQPAHVAIPRLMVLPQDQAI